MIKCIKLSLDGMLCLSTGSDGTLRLWDIGQRKCISVYGNARKKKASVDYHTDSIWSLDVNSKFDQVFTAGKDGNIFKVDLLKETTQLVSKGSDEFPIFSLKYDEKWQKLWYSTPESSVHCLD